MDDIEVLNAVFHFKHKAPSDRQEATVCNELVKLFTGFVASVEAVDAPGLKCGRVEPLTDDRSVPASAFTVHEVEVLRQASQRLTASGGRHKRGDVWYDPWLPKYGCVLQRSQKNAVDVALQVVSIDGWERSLHFLPTGQCVHSAVPSTYSPHTPQCCAVLDTKLEIKFSTVFATELRKAQSNRGSERSAATNELGHQKTPQFISAVVKRTVDSLMGNTQGIGDVSFAAQGGTTDVGQHTGGRARDTCWALVQEVVARSLSCERGLFRKTMVAMKLKLLQEAVDKTGSVFCCDNINLEEGCARVDDLFYMLQVVVQNTVELLECKYQVSPIKDQCAALRSRIEEFVDALNRQTAARFVLPDAAMLGRLNTLSCEMKIESPKRLEDSDNSESTEERHQRAWSNLEGCFILDGVSSTFAELLQWENSNECPAAYKCILTLRTFEAFMVEKAQLLNGSTCGQGASVSLESIQILVTQYQQRVRQWRQLSRLTSVLGVEQRSREMLVVWIAFCLVHQICVHEVPLCAEYNIALDWRDLKVAVLRDQAAISALQRVATYIRRWNEATRGAPLFHSTNQTPTFDFGLRFGLSSSSVVEVYNREVEIWDSHVRRQWGLIELKKTEAAQLRAHINLHKQALVTKRQQLASEEERLSQEYARIRRNNSCYYVYPQSAVKDQLERDIQRIKSDIRNKEAALSRVLAAPRFLVRALPPATNDAIQVIFMLTMPRNLEILGSLCLTAQRALAPADATSEMTRLPALSPTTWQQFHSHFAPSQALYATSKVFTPTLAPYSYPHSLGPQSVDDLHNLQQYSVECVWNPTLYGTALTWMDSSGMKIDPFAATEASVINSFVEPMPGGFRDFQWMNNWPGQSDTRGNLSYANLHQQPDDFEKSAFIALGSLRAFPNQQYRKLQWALLEDNLPWSNACVATIVRQSLYQVGSLTDEVNPQLLWKTDMLSGNEGLDTFCATLASITDKLEQTRRNFENVPLLSELAGFALQYSNNARQIVKMFGGMTRRWAEETRSEYKEESSPDRIARIRRKECVLYGFAVLAYSLGPWDDEAAQEVCELIVLFRTSFLCASINLRSNDQMLRTESKIVEMMSRRNAELVAYVKNSGIDTVLTGLMRLVSATSPERLEWKQFSELSTNGEQFGCCFEAIDTRMDTHYAINLFTGVVLTDGYAPGGLPVDIRRHERFQSLFGPSNFEVFSTNGVLRTERTYCGRLYDFALDQELFVQELSVDSCGEITSTLQLCTTSWVNALRYLLPAQLRKLYSHWYWVEENCVLFRPKEAKCREVFFMATFGEGGSLRCYKVPFSDTKRPCDQLLSHLDDYDQFVQRDGPLLSIFKILTKFEAVKFLYPLRSPEGILKIELPRFKLTFALNSNMELESVEHKGYILATSQQFDDFLPRFSRYLLLELQDKSHTAQSELRMLLPVGGVGESDGTVEITISKTADSRVDVHCYDVHRRLKTFETETIAARLQLAAVCTRAGTNAPSKRLQMTGAEAAVQMLRACRSSRPYSSFERDTLFTIYKLSYREPAVKILAVALLREANRLGFLFGHTQVMNTAMACIDEETEYDVMCMQRVQRNPLRSQFRSNEEEFVLGHVQHASVPVPAIEIVSCRPSPVADDYVKSVEAKLKFFLRIETVTAKDAPQLPLNTDTVNAMSKGMLDELQISWETFHSQVEPTLKTSPKELVGSFTSLLSEVSSRRFEMESYLRESYSKATSSTRDQLLALANYLPTLTVTDIVQCGFDEETQRTLTPKLSEESREEFKKAVLKYMELCVLEDKLERLIWKATRGDELSDAQLVDELVNIRQWQSVEFPYWLAFEVEGRLQIRHEQFVIAQHLINSPGTVCQLNMGRGKTRVILPMLFLHFTLRRCPRVIRAHFLSPLLSEARQFMHRYLSASSAHLGVFEQPFHRQIDLNARRLEFIRDNLEELKRFGGVQLVAPEHRMSLELKRLELGNEGPIVEVLDEILDGDQFVDVLDECDALLHHKYHLVYAVGTPIPLCSGVERWKAAEALLRVVADRSLGSRVAAVLQASHVSCVSPDYSTRLGAYDGTRLNTVVESTKSRREELKRALVLDLIDSAPFELMWLNAFGSTAARESLVRAIAESTVSLEQALGTHMSKFRPYTSQLLALRGLVAFGVLEHCLEKRYRVNFGLPPPHSRPKKIAIPFRAADVPSERSEFSHPDVCIVLTLLGYYHRGLTSEELRSTFQTLLRLDISEQQQLYDQWFKRVKSGLSGEARKALRDVRHISLADARQFEALCQVYRFSMGAINFYLNTCVFPKDTQQYPQRLSRTAWNLAAGANNIGFSGTNDNHRLLPLSVTQREPEEPSLLGTNGKMIGKILQVTHNYEVIHPSPDRSSIPWQSALLFAMDKKAHALIDTGALLAGVANHDAAKFLLNRVNLDSRA